MFLKSPTMETFGRGHSPNTPTHIDTPVNNSPWCFPLWRVSATCNATCPNVSPVHLASMAVTAIKKPTKAFRKNVHLTCFIHKVECFDSFRQINREYCMVARKYEIYFECEQSYVVFDWLAKMIFSHVKNIVYFTCV